MSRRRDDPRRRLSRRGGLLALGVVWLADRPGQVAITWLGYRIETSVMVAVVAVVAVAIVAVLLWSLAALHAALAGAVLAVAARPPRRGVMRRSRAA